MRRVLAVGLVLVATGTACSGAGRPHLTDDTLGDQQCSADGMVLEPVDSDGLPSPVASTRQQLIDAALACNFRALSRIARDSQVDLRYEGDAIPVRVWRELEADGAPVLRPLAGLLSLAHVRKETDAGTEFTWPTAVDWPFADVGNGQDRQALQQVVGEDGIFGWAEAGGYSGWRVAIGPDGRWLHLWYGPVDGEYD